MRWHMRERWRHGARWSIDAFCWVDISIHSPSKLPEKLQAHTVLNKTCELIENLQWVASEPLFLKHTAIDQV